MIAWQKVGLEADGESASRSEVVGEFVTEDEVLDASERDSRLVLGWRRSVFVGIRTSSCPLDGKIS